MQVSLSKNDLFRILDIKENQLGKNNEMFILKYIYPSSVIDLNRI
jgi:hypothetical protein